MKKLLIAGLISLSFQSFAETTIINELLTAKDKSVNSELLFTDTFLLKVNRIIDNENIRLLKIRNKLLIIKSKVDINLKDSNFISELSLDYNIYSDDDPEGSLDSLLVMVDIVPKGLIFSHLISESFKDGYQIDNLNYFNKPCIEDDCLIDIPTMKYSLLEYGSVYDSIDEYIHNMNTNSIFEKLRNQRVKDRLENVPFDSYVYIDFLSVFGGDDFVLGLKNNIDTYELWKYDN